MSVDSGIHFPIPDIEKYSEITLVKGDEVFAIGLLRELMGDEQSFRYEEIRLDNGTHRIDTLPPGGVALNVYSPNPQDKNAYEVIFRQRSPEAKATIVGKKYNQAPTEKKDLAMYYHEVGSDPKAVEFDGRIWRV